MAQLPAIHFQEVSKRFALAAETPQTVLETIIGVFRRRRREKALWAVLDVSFSVFPGQSFGIIGRNGSGKSTALKLAAGILKPTSGQVYVRGRVSALLELGAGFHADLTGRDNIYLNGSILGLNRAEIDERYDAIVEFSELGDFIDTPVKHYSSGMYMRLGFSVAVHVDPAILIVDEILAVGDYAFQMKCLDRIRKMRQDGVTIVMVSHHLQTMRNLCTHLIWMEHGRVKAAGKVQTVIEQYMDHFREEAQPGGAVSGFRRWGTGDVEINNVRLLDGAGEAKTAFGVEEAISFEIQYDAHRPVECPEFGLAIYSQDGTHIAGPNNIEAGFPIEKIEGPGVVRLVLEGNTLLPGRYRLTAAIHDTILPQAFDFHEQAYTFQIKGHGEAMPEGVIRLPAHWEWAPARSMQETLKGFSS